MSGLNINFTPTPKNRSAERLSMQAWYNISGPDGSIEKSNIDGKDLFPFEPQMHGKILAADIESRRSTLRKNRFTTPFSYTYSRYLELREVLAKDPATKVEKDMARLKLDPNIAIKFYQNGSLMSAMLNGDQPYHGIKLQGGTSIMLTPDGDIVFAILAGEQPIKVGSSTLIGKSGTEISYHSNGSLKQITIASPYRMRWAGPDGTKRVTTCRPDTVIIYYDNGQPKSFDSEEYNGYIYLLENGDFDDYSAR